MSNAARVVSLNVSAGGVPKRSVASAVVSVRGVAGDRQNDTVHHGGPDRAVCIYSLELIEALQREGHPIAPGTAGENITIAGLDWGSMAPGTRLKIANVLLQVVSYTSPCSTIRRSFAGGEFTRISQKTNPGWSRVYARVLEVGELHAGDPVELVTAAVLA